MSKKQYRVRNWNKYNESLVHRGSITFWLDEKIVTQWQPKQKIAKRGRPLQYTNVAVELTLTLRAVFHLTLRALAKASGKYVSMVTASTVRGANYKLH